MQSWILEVKDFYSGSSSVIHRRPPLLLLLIQTHRAALKSMILFFFLSADEYATSLSPLPSRCPIPLFWAHASLHCWFSWCAVGERGQPHPCAEWHSMRRRKEEEKSCRVLPLMSKSMHLSLKRWKRGRRKREREAIGKPEDQAKTLTQKQLPHAMNRSLF